MIERIRVVVLTLGRLTRYGVFFAVTQPTAEFVVNAPEVAVFDRPTLAGKSDQFASGFGEVALCFVRHTQ